MTATPKPRLRFRDILPKGLYWRTFLIIVAPAALLQLIITLVFLDDHWQATSKRMSQGVAADVALVIQLYERNPTQENFEQLREYAMRPLRLEIELQPGAELAVPRCRAWGSTLDRYLLRALQTDINRDVFYDSTCPGPQVLIRVPIENGVLQLKAYRDRVQARSGPLFVAWISGATIFLLIVSIIFIRNQVRPIEKLADAMERFGRGEDTGYIRARGAREVRGATLAFQDMRQRIKKHIDQRSQLLAGVSHDLRTPLTRLKLQLAMMPQSPEIDDIKRDLAEMESPLTLPARVDMVESSPGGSPCPARRHPSAASSSCPRRPCSPSSPPAAATPTWPRPTSRPTRSSRPARPRAATRRTASPSRGPGAIRTARCPTSSSRSTTTTGMGR